jgi:hypothetical protein
MRWHIRCRACPSGSFLRPEKEKRFIQSDSPFLSDGPAACGKPKVEVSECLQTKGIARKWTRFLLQRASFASSSVDLVRSRNIEHELADLTCELERSH